MNLRDYLYINKKQIQDLAKEIGYSKSAIQIYLAHKVKCSDKLAKAIEMHTMGAVSAQEMIEWNERGMEEKKRAAGMKITSEMRRCVLQEISHKLCDECNKKLTKRVRTSKKE